MTTLLGQLQVYVYDPTSPFTNPLTLLSTLTSVAYEDNINDVGSGQVTVPDTPALNTNIFNKECFYQIVWTPGIAGFAPLTPVFTFLGENVQFVQIPGPEGGGGYTIAGRGIGQWLDKMVTFPTGWPSNPQGGQYFYASTYANTVQTLLSQGQGRGVATWITQNVWTASVDSNSNAWGESVNVAVPSGTTLLTWLKDVSLKRPLDWHMGPTGALSLFTSMGSNKQTSVEFWPGQGLVSAQATADWTNVWNAILFQDSTQVYNLETDATTITSYTRRETFASSQATIGTAAGAAQATQLLNTWKVPIIEEIASVEVAQVGHRPYVDYNIGDTISVVLPGVGGHPMVMQQGGSIPAPLAGRVLGIGASVGGAAGGVGALTTPASSGALSPLNTTTNIAPASGQQTTTTGFEITLNFMLEKNPKPPTLSVLGIEAKPIFIQTTAANRPTAGLAGRLHYATDTTNFSMDSGTAWVALPVLNSAAGNVQPDGTALSAGSSAAGARCDHIHTPLKHILRVHITAGTPLSVPNNAFTAIKFQTVDEDTDSGYSASTGLYTIPFSGFWRFTCNLGWANNATGIRAVQIVPSGALSGSATAWVTGPTGVFNDDANCAVDARCAAGDTVVVHGYQTSGAALNTNTGLGCFFTASMQTT